MNTMKAIRRRIDDDADQQAGEIAPWPAEFQRIGDGRGEGGDDAGEDDQRRAVADAAAVICSPSHIRNIVPPISVSTVEMRKNQPGSVTTPRLPSRPTAMPYAWKAASATVR